MVLPKLLREEMHLGLGDTLELEREGERIILRLYVHRSCSRRSMGCG
ncbi:MAG: AbrB/MazE/SpoVT family DNA-binding domain-containing protein [Acidobacteria bacterium]|nr:AbrB/MazE/SpoVT family DNA-binding domain-containing protein [Acidobacteriota bacterium]